MRFINLIINLFIGKGFLLFSLFLFFTITKSQIFQRFSDQKKFEDLTIIRDQQKINLNKNNFKNFIFKDGDRVLYEDKLTEFTIDNDTLIFFDKVKEIESVALKILTSTIKLKEIYLLLS